MSDAEVEAVAPLDAYATAKPDEPTFTLQGGDPLAGPLVRLWALFARRRAGLARIDPNTWFAEIIEAAIGSLIDSDEREVDNLKIRATAAEVVSWSMDDYRKGNHTDKPTEAANTHLTELQRIDLHDMKVRVAQQLSSFSGALVEMREELEKRGFNDLEALSDMKTASYNLRLLNEMIEPRRIFKKG